MLLASKSNYQNLLEGNRLPGVTYPDSLSTGLSSKRTSHKVAEQGRRNRINDALKEMHALIPKAASTPKGISKEPEVEEEMGLEGKESNNASKAATVEMANEYIRRMQEEQAERDKKIRC